MITKITGTLVSLSQERAVIAAEPFEYEVLIPEFTRRQLQQDLGKTVSLHTIYSLDGNPQGKISPKLIGFLTEAEREFFDLFCSVDGVGTKKALRAMVRPVREVATAIEEKDEKFLASLPGIGAAMSERIVAKLRRKVPKFALLISREAAAESSIATDVISETYEALLALGHTESDARRLIDAVCETKKKFKDSAELIQAIYTMQRQ
ncbi:MAG: helix-hairpin-helix domain-containing protein [Planctomycetaceae bacterium]|nr:helix-hairpin-helix domain-containing protein [Planctomycetaceae bacterium]MCL2304921.1 helix-hairpin-helix domain-containing protein [Planctomycetaceae bacterium]